MSQEDKKIDNAKSRLRPRKPKNAEVALLSKPYNVENDSALPDEDITIGDAATESYDSESFSDSLSSDYDEKREIPDCMSKLLLLSIVIISIY
jgi:hypothetical protein